MDRDDTIRFVIKLKAKVIKAVLKRKRGPNAKRRVRYIRCIFRDLKNGKVKDQTICKKVWKEIAEDRGGRCPDEELRKKRIRIREIRLDINRILHGENLNSPFKLDLPFYIERFNNGLIPHFFYREKIRDIIEADRETIETKLKTLKKFDIDINIIDLWNKRNRKIFWQRGYQACDIEIGFHKDEIQLKFLDNSQDVNVRIESNRRRKCYEFNRARSKSENYFFPFTTYGLFKVNTPIIYRSLELILKRTNYFNFLAAQEDFKKNRGEYKDIDVLKPLPEISHSISPAALLVIEDNGEEIAIFAKRLRHKQIGTGSGLIGLPIDNTPIRPPTDEEREKLKALDLKIPDPDDQDEFLFHNRLIKGAKLELNVEIGLEDIKILAFGLDTKRYLYNLIGIVRKKITYDDLEKKVKSAKFRLYKNLVPKPFFPKNIIDYIKDLPEEECCPTTQAAALFALCQKYGLEEVTKHIKRNRKRT